jgi:hypothetical protein
MAALAVSGFSRIVLSEATRAAKVYPFASALPSRRASSTSVPMPLLTATSAPMPFAQKPSSFPSSSAFAAIRPKEVVFPMMPGTGPIFTSRSGSMPAAESMRFKPSTGPGAAPIR